jgi:hypothetical protein
VAINSVLAPRIGGKAVPLKIRSPAGVLSFISTTTVSGSPVDVTLQELALATIFPLDEFTKSILRALDVS